MLIADPYPVAAALWALTPIVDVPFYDVEARVANLNLDDPQPPGYQYRLPISGEYDPWVERRSQVPLDTSHEPLEGEISCLPLCDPRFQGISYYEAGLWFHVGGSVNSWCSDPPDSDGRRMVRGGSWLSLARDVRAAYQNWVDPGLAGGVLGYRLVRGFSQTGRGVAP